MSKLLIMSCSESYRDNLFLGMIGASDLMQQLFTRIEKYAPTEAPVVITGETGTGKEMVARALHRLSNRSNGAFVAINCTAIHEDLLESELFGHERGAFTGAVKEHRGRFERAHKGTLFLDEIGDMPQSVQVKLLRVLEERKFERIGGESLISVDVRIIAATNIPLERAVGSNRFRSDLYHRIAVLRLHVPSLRQRKTDVPLLVEYFLDVLNRRYKKNIQRLTPDAVRLLQEYNWPGNIRELRNVLERVYVETETHVIGRNAFREWEKERDYLAAGSWDLQNYDYNKMSRDPIVPPMSPQSGWHHRRTEELPRREPPRALLPHSLAGDESQEFIEGEFRVIPDEKSTEEITPELLKKAYTESGGNITAASRRLGIHKATFYRYMRRFNLTREKM